MLHDNAPVPVVTTGLRVDAGSVDLYLDWPGRAGRRRRLVTLDANDIALPLSLTPAASAPAEARLLAFPAPGAQLSRFAIAPFLASLDNNEPAAMEAAQRWIDRTAGEAPAETPVLARVLLDHHARLSSALAISEASRDDSEAMRIAGKAARDRAVLTASVAPLIAPAADSALHDASLASAFRAVAEASAVTLPATPPPDTGEDDGVADLAAWAGVRTRRVRLAPGWWRSGGQSMLGFRRDDGSPVALIAGTGWRSGYRIRAAGRDRAVDSKTAATLADHGYVLQRRLPDAHRRRRTAALRRAARLAGADGDPDDRTCRQPARPRHAHRD